MEIIYEVDINQKFNDVITDVITSVEGKTEEEAVSNFLNQVINCVKENLDVRAYGKLSNDLTLPLDIALEAEDVLKTIPEGLGLLVVFLYRNYGSGKPKDWRFFAIPPGIHNTIESFGPGTEGEKYGDIQIPGVLWVEDDFSGTFGIILPAGSMEFNPSTKDLWVPQETPYYDKDSGD